MKTRFHQTAFLKLLQKTPQEVTKSDIKYYLETLIRSGYPRPVIEEAVCALEHYSFKPAVSS